MIRALYRLIFFRLMGWKIEGQLPSFSKYIVIVAPHTSNWDFLIGVFTRRILKFKPCFVAKKELFRFPFGYFFRWMGGFPVDRSKNSNFVNQMTALFARHNAFILTFTPEGTRKFNVNWKTGYYYVAKAANVPVVPVSFDYKNKCVTIGEAEYQDMSVEESLAKYKTYFSQFKGKHIQEL